MNLIDKRGNGNSYCAFDNFTLMVPKAEGQPDPPSISFVGDDIYDYKKLVVNVAEGTADEYTLSYRIGDSGNYSTYSEPVLIDASCTVYAKTTVGGIDSLEISRDVVACAAIPSPTAAITGVNGTSRTVTITSDFDVAVAADEAGEYIDSAKMLTTAETTNYYIKAYFDSVVNEGVRRWSAPISVAVEAGSAVTLANPALRRKGFGYLYVNASQANVVSSPVPDIHYAVNGGAETIVTASEYYIPIDGKHGTSVTVWVEKDGFTASESTTYAVDYSTVPANYKKVASVDIVGICRASNQGVSYSSDTINICDRDYHTSFAIGEGKLTDAESKIPMYFNKDIREGSGSRWNNNRENGLYCYSLTKYVAIKDLEAGDIIYANASSASASQNLSLRSSSDYEYFFNVVADGDVAMQFSVNSYVYGICVYKKRKGFMLIIQ